MIYRPKDSRLSGVQLPRLHNTVPVRIELTPAEREVYRYIQFIHPFKSHWAQFVRLRQDVFISLADANSRVLTRGAMQPRIIPHCSRKRSTVEI
jgi:hypothetical protein